MVFDTVAPLHIGQVERGEKSIGVEDLVQIARALGVHTRSLVVGL